MTKGFSLIEVELSLLVLSMGVLSVVGLYPLGFRECTAAKDDMLAVAASESVMSRVVSALSDTNLAWSTWKEAAESGTVGGLPGAADFMSEVPPDWSSRLTVTEGDAARMCVRLQVSPRPKALEAAPQFYTEVRFQGRTR